MYFQHDRWFWRAANLLRQELAKQILADGGHYERSPMYHQLVLNRLLDALRMLRAPTTLHDGDLTRLLTEKSVLMLAWLKAVTFQNGDIPRVNDTALGIAPNTRQLREKASRLIPKERVPTISLTDSGYRMFRQKRYELFASVGSIGPAHQPGHAHADTLSFVLNVDNQPVLVDSGTSTYQPGPRRDWERSTEAHNTVTLHSVNSSEVWAGFRVGRRARVTILTDTPNRLMARHDGYQHRGLLHERTWSIAATAISITDRLLDWPASGESKQSGTARFHFHPSVTWQVLGNGVEAGPTKIAFHSVSKPVLRVKGYALANGFNQLVESRCLEVDFTGTLETILTLS